ncbi:hypothetical protein ACOMHN_055486 [Nucella lapillus]
MFNRPPSPQIKAGIKLYFFPARARAEPIRLTLAAAGRKFEDIRVLQTQWAAEQAKSPYGQMPYIVHKGKTYGESKAIASFVARECSLAGQSLEDGLRVDEVYCVFSAFLEQLAPALMQKDAAKKAEMLKTLSSDAIPKYLGYFERMLKESGTGYFVGSALSQADLTVYDITHTLLKQNPQVLGGFPEIRRVRTNVETNKNVQAYLNTRPDPDL